MVPSQVMTMENPRTGLLNPLTATRNIFFLVLGLLHITIQSPTKSIHGPIAITLAVGTCSFPGMSGSIHQVFIEISEPDQIQSEHEDNYQYQDDSTDESHCINIINAILSGTARLNVLLPTATILAFTIFTPLLSNNGECSLLNSWLMGCFLALLATSCIFFSITDSFRTAAGRLYYGVATVGGIWTFNGERKKPCVASDYRLRWADLFHGSLSLVAFLTFAMSYNDVRDCYDLQLSKMVVNTLPLVVGFVISGMFVVFPSRRRGLGYPFLLQGEAFRPSRN